jgi:predicted RNase H-like nuclease
MAPVAGVDACRGGWVAIVVDGSGFVDSRLAPTFREILDRTPGAAEIGVDIPIGLPADGARAADIAAREFVGPRRNSVFPTPTRAALAAATYAEARSVFPSLSAQSYALGKKILEVGPLRALASGSPRYRDEPVGSGLGAPHHTGSTE